MKLTQLISYLKGRLKDLGDLNTFVMQEAKCAHCGKITQYESEVTDVASSLSQVILIGQELI